MEWKYGDGHAVAKMPLGYSNIEDARSALNFDVSQRQREKAENRGAPWVICR